MDKKFLTAVGILVIIIILGAAVFGYWYYKKPTKPVETTNVDMLQQAGNSTDDLSNKASQGVLPQIDPGSNPMEKAPDTNPVSKTNPYSGVKTNPFQ
jgi:hypothetical protein